MFKVGQLDEEISIHAPSRERPGYIKKVPINQIISIHAPSRERPALSAIVAFRSHFNPRSLTGATGAAMVGHRCLGFQSTLPHGSDCKQQYFRCLTQNFNPRSLTGATARHMLTHMSAKFQSTLPHGSDRKAIMHAVTISSFQSTLPHGSDLLIDITNAPM
mgnify:CR=1 FL=1